MDKMAKNREVSESTLCQVCKM